MANNRMFLVHKSTGRKHLLCKYYPTTAWYLYTDEERLNAFLEDVTRTVLKEGADYMWGPTDFTLEFEVADERS